MKLWVYFRTIPSPFRPKSGHGVMSWVASRRNCSMVIASTGFRGCTTAKSGRQAIVCLGKSWG